MNCSATLNCGELVCFLFVLCHSQDGTPALCREMEKGISGCSTLTKLSLRYLPPQCASASVRAALALQSSLTEVEWSDGSFRSKSDIAVTVLVCCVLCVVCAWVYGERLREGRRDCVCKFAYDCLGCMFVCACLKCICSVCAHHL